MSRGGAGGAGGGAAPLADEAARRAAVTTFDRNIVVTAGAGTGKTALLVERALNLIAGEGVPVESIAAITFTEKAAAELRQRLAAGLDGLRRLADGIEGERAAALPGEARRSFAWLARGDAPLPAATIEKRALAALHGLESASVGTIHAFCADLLRRHPRAAGVDPRFAVDEGAAFERLFDDEWERFLAEELGFAPARPELWRRLLGSAPGALPAVRDLARALASFGVAWRAGEARPALDRAGRHALIGDDVERLAAECDRLRAGLPAMNRNLATFLATAASCLRGFLDGGAAGLRAAPADRTLAEFVEQDLPAAGKGVSEADAFPLRAAAERARDLVAALARVDEARVAQVVEAAAPLARRARERLLAAGFVSFDALLRLTRDLLRERPAIRRELGGRFRAILLDEFQDTDPLQYEILFFIAEEDGAAAAGAWECRPAAGRLFIVGDPKQSIYRFRGADIDAYEAAVARVLECGGMRLSLVSSFRSPREIVDPINALFAAWLPAPAGADEASQPPYEALVAAHAGAADAPRPAVAIWSVEAGGNAPDRRRGEAEAIAAWIAAERRGEAGGAPLACGDVVILLRALTNAAIYARALRQAGIPFVVEGGKDFRERPEVGDLIAFLRAAADPNHAPALLAVMRSPLGGVPDAELARFAAAGGRLDRRGGGIDTASFPGVRRTFALVEEFRARSRGCAPDVVVRRALRDTPIVLLHAAAFEGAQRVANLRRLAAEAEALARAGLSLEEALDALEESFAGGRDPGESPLADETVNAVRILSVHKAKGLEFPAVIVPDIGRPERPPADTTTRAVVLQAPAGALAVRLADGATNLAWARHALAARRHEAAEEKRVFYVACTRARDRLILVNSDRGERDAPWRDALAHLGYVAGDDAPTPGGLLAHGVAHRRLAPRPPAAEPPPADPDPAWTRAAGTWTEAAESLRAAARPLLRRPSTAPAGPPETAALPRAHAALREAAAAGAGSTARLAGSAVHAALASWDFRTPDALRRLARDAARRLAVVPGAAGGAAARRAAQAVEEETTAIVEQFLRGPLAERLAAAEILGREVPLLLRDADGTTWIGSCDLIYRDREGTLVAADYKTDRLPGDAALTAGAAAAVYAPQVGVYREAARRLFPGCAVRAEILFVRHGTRVALADGPG